ncbi:hypothetical protein [Planomicrobium sp. CPCC 101079]|uniref:hypothetical protein n=1 Tax=Planomicrobium sp. CPCC 101079 TaxID=2599618 RepID=UPI0011B83130|nr:hypothetical protein [Planomicrobium sp. CPCC 101079]TWT09249.1 hypothetical protein FQV28_06340 [Planomicrobium sp. CPCC 101079]
MITWNYVDWGGSIDQGLTNTGFPVYEVEIKGWNDNQNYSDLEDLLIIRVVHTYSSVEAKMIYLHPDAKCNLKVRKLAKETQNYLVDAIQVNG